MPLQSLVPMIHVRNVPRSIAFYRKLGFEVGNTFSPAGQAEPGWAWLFSGGAQLMIARAAEPVDASRQNVLLYLYTSDVAAMRSSLLQEGVPAGEISCPFYAPKGEFRIEDPDGYILLVTHT